MSNASFNDGRIIGNRIDEDGAKIYGAANVSKEYYIPLENGVVVVRTEGNINKARPEGSFVVLWITEPGIDPVFALPSDIILMKNA